MGDALHRKIVFLNAIAKFGLWKGVFEALHVGASLQTPKRYLAVSLQCINDFNISHPCKNDDYEEKGKQLEEKKQSD